MICHLCQKQFNSLSGLHGHVNKTHKTSQADYYHEFAPRYDLHTGDLISYKDYKHYHESDFNDRESFSDWLADHYKEESTKEYVLAKIKERMTRKMITQLPSHFSLKSLFLPSCHGFERMYGGMDKFVAAMRVAGVELSYQYAQTPILREGPMKIFCDTREQKMLSFGCEAEIMKLSVGDYVPGGEFYSDVYVDRKSLPDLAGTMSAGRERVEREIQRAKDLNFYLVFVIEDLYSNILHYSANTSFCRKLNGAHILHEIRTLTSTYDNIQFVACGSRARASTVIENIFRLKEQAKVLDLEYLKDRQLI